jgi:hypothetical protein
MVQLIEDGSAPVLTALYPCSEVARRLTGFDSTCLIGGSLRGFPFYFEGAIK